MPWTDNISIDRHFNNIKLLIGELDITRETLHLLPLHPFLITLEPVHPRLQYLAVLCRRSPTFGEGDDVVVLVAEAAVAAPEALADDIAGGVAAPPVGVAAGNHVGALPAERPGLGVEGTGAALLFIAVVVSWTVVVWYVGGHSAGDRRR